MASTVKFSLYEIFGYLIPGAIAFSAAMLLDTAIFHYQHRPALEWLGTKPGLAAAIGAAYLAGHVVQIIATVCLPETNSILLKSKRYMTTQRLYARVCKRMRTEQAGMTGPEVLAACDGDVLASGPAGEREIYVYREGFYRGNAVSLAICGFACLLIGGLDRYEGLISELGSSRPEVLTASILCVVIAIGMYFRGLRFANYRLVLGLALTSQELKMRARFDQLRNALSLMFP